MSLVVRVFTNGLRDWGSLPGQVIEKTQKMVFDPSSLNTQYYKVHIKSKVVQSRERSSYGNGSLQVALHHGCQLYLLLYICIYQEVFMV